VNNKKPAGREVWRAFGAISRDTRPYPDLLAESGWQSRNVAIDWRMQSG
jgi:hypothetical protein